MTHLSFNVPSFFLSPSSSTEQNLHSAIKEKEREEEEEKKLMIMLLKACGRKKEHTILTA